MGSTEKSEILQIRQKAEMFIIKLTTLGVSMSSMGFIFLIGFGYSTCSSIDSLVLSAPSGQDGDESSDISRQDLVLRMSIFDGLQ